MCRKQNSPLGEDARLVPGEHIAYERSLSQKSDNVGTWKICLDNCNVFLSKTLMQNGN